MSNPFQNFTRNLAGTSPQKIYNDLLNSNPVKGVTEFGKGLAQNLGSAYNVANTYTRGGLDQAMNNPILNPLSVPYKAINSIWYLMVHGNYEVLKINIQFWYKRKFKRFFFHLKKKAKV